MLQQRIQSPTKKARSYSWILNQRHGICHQGIEKSIEEHKEAKAVIVAHLYGTPAKVDEIKAICEENIKVPLIEDAAESLGATYKRESRQEDSSHGRIFIQWK